MKVFYDGPGAKTYHPQLGKLITGKVFELDAKTAKSYVEAGLLKKAKEGKKADAGSRIQDAGTKKQAQEKQAGSVNGGPGSAKKDK